MEHVYVEGLLSNYIYIISLVEDKEILHKDNNGKIVYSNLLWKSLISPIIKEKPSISFHELAEEINLFLNDITAEW